MTRVPWWGPVAVLVLVHGDAAGGIVRGQLSLMVGRSKVSPTNVVISVDSLARPSRSKPRGRVVVMTQEGQRFVPSVIAIQAGSDVRFENRDGLYHNVFSVSRAKRFDIGKYAPGKTHTVTFDRPGTVQLLCDMHPDETGWVVVQPHHWFTQPDARGNFKLPWLPAGHYTVRAWSPRFGVKKRFVNVTRTGVTQVKLTF